MKWFDFLRFIIIICNDGNIFLPIKFLYLRYLFLLFQKIVREGGRRLQSLTSEQRSAIIEDYAKRMLDNSKAILEANKLDLELAKKNSKLQTMHIYIYIYSIINILNLKSRFKFRFIESIIVEWKKVRNTCRRYASNRGQHWHSRQSIEMHQANRWLDTATDYCSNWCVARYFRVQARQLTTSKRHSSENFFFSIHSK